MNQSIRDHFKPYQPSIAFSGEEAVIYEEKSPADQIKDYVHCYWRLYTPEPLKESFKYRVVSDGCIDILFEQSASENIFVTGFSTQFLEYDLGTSFDYLGIRFLPTGFPALFDRAASELTNEFLPLVEVLPEFHKVFIRAFRDLMELSLAIGQFDDLLKDQLSNLPTASEVDPRLLSAMHVILQSGGRIPLSQLDVGVSERQLRRLFEYYFGESPKTFARIIRFQHILGAKPSLESLKNNKIFYDGGYYDQAHFIKEFKAFYGVTPNKAFGR
ncbi:MAG: helix-turn-helix domain-containing protein [Cytophagales bacterium]|nr:helix-turn-helix domain-containing protein [Cytophagales bacterium]